MQQILCECVETRFLSRLFCFSVFFLFLLQVFLTLCAWDCFTWNWKIRKERKRKKKSKKHRRSLLTVVFSWWKNEKSPCRRTQKTVLMKQTRMQTCSVAVIEMFLCVMIFSGQKARNEKKKKTEICRILLESVAACDYWKKKEKHSLSCILHTRLVF